MQLSMARSRVFAVLGRRGLQRTASLQSSSDCLPVPLCLLPPDTVDECDRSGRHRAVVRTQDPRILHQQKALLRSIKPGFAQTFDLPVASYRTARVVVPRKSVRKGAASAAP